MPDSPALAIYRGKSVTMNFAIVPQGNIAGWTIVFHAGDAAQPSAAQATHHGGDDACVMVAAA